MTQPDLDQLTPDQIANMPGDQLLRLAADTARHEAEDDADHTIAALFDTGARAYRSDDPAEHRAVTYALAEMARVLLRADLDDQTTVAQLATQEA